jgi:hypothetical protein
MKSLQINISYKIQIKSNQIKSFYCHEHIHVLTRSHKQNKVLESFYTVLVEVDNFSKNKQINKLAPIKSRCSILAKMAIEINYLVIM